MVILKFLYKSVYLQRILKTNVIKKSTILLFIFSLLMPFLLSAEPEAATKENTKENSDVSAKVVEHIMNHVADANQYHVVTISGHHFTFPLPCILYRKSTGKWTVCLS